MENFEKATMIWSVLNKELELLDDLHDSGDMSDRAYSKQVNVVTTLFKGKISELLGRLSKEHMFPDEMYGDLVENQEK